MYVFAWESSSSFPPKKAANLRFKANIVDYAIGWQDETGEGDIKSDRVTNFKYQVRTTEFAYELWKLAAEKSVVEDEILSTFFTKDCRLLQQNFVGRWSKGKGVGKHINFPSMHLHCKDPRV